jgi:CubicO group peptidase (beta-lactamase class C family)
MILALVFAADLRVQAQEPAGEIDLGADPRVAEAAALLEVWLDAELAHDRIPGIAAGFVHDQDVVWKQAFGVADRDSGRPVTTDTLFSICSISKLFTSVAVMQQRDAGRLDLDDEVSEHLDWFRIGDAYPDAAPVRIRGVLTHSSGLPRESDYPYWSGPDFTFPTRDQIIERVGEQAELYPGETYYQYSNLGLTLAGEVAAAVAGQPYADYVRANILDPLEMNDTYPEIPTDHDRMATGYGVLGRDGVREQIVRFAARGIAPAAGYASTVEDLARFSAWQFRLLSDGGNEVLDANTLREMQRVQWVDPDWGAHRGLGFGVWRANDTTYVGHGGSCPGFRSHLSLQTDDKVAAIAMANAMINPNRYTAAIHKAMAPRVKAALAEPDGAEAPDPELDRYLGLYRSFWGEAAVVRWEGGLAVLSLPSADPVAALSKLKHVDGSTFRRVRDDGSLGEPFRFDVDGEGRVLRYWQHSNPSDRVR